MYRRLLKYLLPHKFTIVVTIVLMFIGAGLNVFTIAAFKPVIEIIFNVPTEQTIEESQPQQPVPASQLEGKEPDTSPQLGGKFAKLTGYLKQKEKELQSKFAAYIRQGKKLTLLAIIGAVIVVANVLRLVFTFLAEYLANLTGLLIIKNLKSQLYHHVLNLDLSFFESKSTGHLMSRIDSDVSGVRQTLMLLFDKVMEAPINIVAIVLFLFYLNSYLTLSLLILFPLTVIPIAYFGRKTRKLTRKERRKVATLSSLMQEILSSIRIVKAFRMENYEISRFDKQNEAHFRYLLKRRKYRILSSPVMDLLGIMAVVALLIIGGYFITATETMSGSVFFIYVFALSRLYIPVKQINKAYGEVQTGLGHAERIFNLLDTPRTVIEVPGALKIPRCTKKIEFDNVYFEYIRGQLVLKNINLEIPAGKTVALVGPSGAGKSTLASLIPRFYDPTQGAVKFDGIDLRQATLDSVRGQIGIVSQEPILFNDTIRNNMAYGRLDIALERVIEAAKAAQAHEFVTAYPLGYDTIIGERGIRLSGGQRQRLTIARAILKDPAILILDEATSSLDSQSEALIQKALIELIKGRTAIIIAHRLSTVMIADEIIVLDKGEIVDQGRHEELLARSGLYAQMCEIQFNFSRTRA